MALSDQPALRHRQIGGAFTDRVGATVAWDVPAPVAGWTARDVVRHLTGWLPAFLAAGGDVELPTGPDPADDPEQQDREQIGPARG